MTSDIPVPTEADYLDASRANVMALFTSPRDVLPPEELERTVAYYAMLPSHRAAVDSAYAAGWRAHIKLYSDSNNALRAGHWPDDGCACYFCRLARGEVPSGLSRSGNPASTERGTP